MKQKSVNGYRVYIENGPPYIVGVAKPRPQRGENVIECQFRTEDEALVSFNAAQANPHEWPDGPVAVTVPPPAPPKPAPRRRRASSG